MKYLSFVPVLQLVILGHANTLWASAEKPETSTHAVVLESIEGRKEISINNGQTQRTVEAGSPIDYGEAIQTGEGSIAILRYPDGSKFALLGSSEFIVEDQINGTKWMRLKFGTLHGIVAKFSSGQSSKLRILIRTRTAALGTNGATFILSVAKGTQLTRIDMIDGAAEIARSELTVLNRKGASLTQGNSVEITRNGISLPKSFKTDELLKVFKISH